MPDAAADSARQFQLGPMAHERLANAGEWRFAPGDDIPAGRASEFIMNTL
ncbi:MAG: hypothetical protein LBP86_01570 [Azoarcus sp.]|jgi:hypothetical protein|nr:hypothetical protein [Azoarcus sp.]